MTAWPRPVTVRKSELAQSGALRPSGPRILLEAVDEAQQLVTVPDAPPFAIVQPVDDAGVFKPLKNPGVVSG